MPTSVFLTPTRVSGERPCFHNWPRRWRIHHARRGELFAQFRQAGHLHDQSANNTSVTRFAPPQDSVWNTSSFSATTMPPACPQPANANTRLYGVSEDCLFLNILTPQGANSETAFLPVMLWV